MLSPQVLYLTLTFAFTFVTGPGNLWLYSCFAFEGTNSKLCKLFYGTQHTELQIMSAINVIQSLPSLLEIIPENYYEYATRLNKQQNSYRNFVQCLGRSYAIQLPSDLIMRPMSYGVHLLM